VYLTRGKIKGDARPESDDFLMRHRVSANGATLGTHLFQQPYRLKELKAVWLVDENLI
jgi:hypothetical protein